MSNVETIKPPLWKRLLLSCCPPMSRGVSGVSSESSTSECDSMDIDVGYAPRVKMHESIVFKDSESES